MPLHGRDSICVEHSMKEDPEAALQSLQAMPPVTYEIAMRDPGFQATVAAVYQNQNKLDIAQNILEKLIAPANRLPARSPAPRFFSNSPVSTPRATTLGMPFPFIAKSSPSTPTIPTHGKAS